MSSVRVVDGHYEQDITCSCGKIYHIEAIDWSDLEYQRRGVETSMGLCALSHEQAPQRMAPQREAARQTDAPPQRIERSPAAETPRQHQQPEQGDSCLPIVAVVILALIVIIALGTAWAIGIVSP